MQELHEEYGDQGLVIIGIPSNDFNQEAGSEEAIAKFAEEKFMVGFKLMEKVHVKGKKIHPLYDFLKRQPKGGKVSWNFTKFLIDRLGNCVSKHLPKVTPYDLVPKIKQLLEEQPSPVNI